MTLQPRPSTLDTQPANLFGLLNCYKPVGITSRDLVNVVQRRVRPQKVGHCGTLDPLAEGVMVLGVGPAVRLTPYIQMLPKHYLAKFQLGASSETGDLEFGCEMHPDLPQPTSEQLERAAESLIGETQQTPPAYSAIWVDGKRAYERARKGESVQMPTRTVHVESIRLVDYQFPEVTLDIRCGSGTYIRSLGIDLAKAAGSIAVMTHLQRVGIGPFSADKAVQVEQLKEEPIDRLLIPAGQGVCGIRKVTVDAADSERLGNGLPVSESVAAQLDDEPAEVAAVTVEGNLRAIMKRKPRGWCPVKVFPNAETSP